MESTMPTKFPNIIALDASVTVLAAEGEAKGPRSFVSEFYTGGELPIDGWDLPVVVDLEGLTNGKVLVANLDHDSSKRVGNFSVANDGKSLIASGTATAATSARDEVVASADAGYQWQASLEVRPTKVETVKPGAMVTVNGQTFKGPLYVTRKGVLKGFAFVSHGADDNTTASIAASAAHQEKNMEPKLKAWIEAMGFDADSLTADQLAGMTANYNGLQAPAAKPIQASDNPFEARKIEAKRRSDITQIADQWACKREGDYEYVVAIEKMRDHAIEAKMTAQDFRNEMYEQSLPLAHTAPAPRSRDAAVNARVIEAALAIAGRLSNLDKVFDEKTLDAAERQFKGGITLGQLYLTCAAANGYTGNRSKVDVEVQRAAFGVGRQIHGGQGWSTIDIANILSNNQNKFFRDGWNSIDLSFLSLASIRAVSDFREITTISLTGNLVFEKVAADGEIKHGTLGDETTGNKVDTYAKMLAITRQDIINDDLGALNVLPRKFGRGAALKLAEIFWTEFLNPTTANFYHTNNANVNTGVADMTVGGLAATETIFLAQVDPDGKPLNLEPKILVVPPAIRAAALTLMSSERLIDGTSTAVQGDANIYRGRFRVVVSPYLANTSYTGYDVNGYYMLADPNDLPMIEIAALNGRIEPTIETADTDFNTLGTQFRAYSDVGVRVQHPEAVVRADGESS
jgi:hypothetical protein